MLRLFVCIWLPNEIIKKINNLCIELKGTGLNAKFVEEKNFHITVTFLGDVNEDKLDEIKTKLEHSLNNINEFHVNLNGLKVLPNENYIRIFGVNVKSEQLKDLIKKVGRDIGGDFHEDQKITLCRVKNITNKLPVKNFIDKNRNISLGEFHVNSISLVKSVLTRDGPIYEVIHEVKLRENERKSSY